MRFQKLLIVFFTLLFIAGCSNEQSLNDFFYESMKTNDNSTIIQNKEYPEGTLVIYSTSSQNVDKYHLGFAKKSEKWSWVGNGTVDFEQSWQGISEDEFNIFYGVSLIEENKNFYVNDTEVEKIKLNDNLNLWYYVDSQDSIKDYEIYAINQDQKKQILKNKVK